MSFDALAPVYRGLETLVFGNALQRARTEFLPELASCRNVLVVGEGNGRFVHSLAVTNPHIRITCVEQSAEMIRLARCKADVEFVHSKIENARLERSYDVIVTNFFLDCFTESELPQIVQKLAADAQSSAIWLVAEFTPAKRGKLLVWLMYRFFRVTTRISASRLPNYAPLLEQHGFRCEQRRFFYAGIVSAELWRRS